MIYLFIWLLLGLAANIFFRFYDGKYSVVRHLFTILLGPVAVSAIILFIGIPQIIDLLERLSKYEI